MAFNCRTIGVTDVARGQRDYKTPLKTPRFVFSRIALLTGAGFTKDCGGFLAKEMWAWIFNSDSVRPRSEVAAALRAEPNYEVVYSDIHNSPKFDELDRAAITQAVRNAYWSQDKAICGFRGNTSGLREFLGWFRGQGPDERGYFFTLNQDLFVERHLSQLEFHVPGVREHRRTFNGVAQYQGDTTPIAFGAEVDETARADAEIGNRLHYVKLHGSMNWRSQVKGDVMVIGSTKTELIRDEQLLRYYLLLFARVLRETRLLCVIGYSFRDEHINEAIAEGIREHGLRLCVLNPQDYGTFQDAVWVAARDQATTITNGIVGYFPHSVDEMFVKENHPMLPELRRVLSG